MKAFLLSSLVLLSVLFLNSCDQSSGSSEQAKEEPLTFSEYAYKQFEGTINGNLKVVCMITRKDTAISGSYFYENKKQPIRLSGTIDKNLQLKVEESMERITANGWDSKKTGEFAGKWENGVWKGTWKNDKNTFPFELKESSLQGSAKLGAKYVEKNYKNPKGGEAHIGYFTLSVESAGNEAAKKAINTDLENALLLQYTEEGAAPKKAASLDKIMDEFIDSYKTDMKDMEQDMEMSYGSDLDQSVEMNQNNLLCIGEMSYLFMGGAHGSSGLSFRNYDLQTGKKLTLSDIFTPNYQKTLNPIGEKYFRTQNAIPAGKKLEDEGFEFENGFALNDNFAIKPDGIFFQYNQYEIASYAAGMPSVMIPYKEIQSLIKPGSSLAEYVKSIAP